MLDTFFSSMGQEYEARVDLQENRSQQQQQQQEGALGRKLVGLHQANLACAGVCRADASAVLSQLRPGIR